MRSVALDERSLARRFVVGGMATCAVAAAVGTSPPAGAFGTLSDGNHIPLEQRVALAHDPNRTVVWSQLRVDAGTGPFAVVVPAAPGAALDWSSNAWMEALEASTAPAILPPPGADAVCAGEPADPDRVHLVGRPYGPTVTPLEVIELPDAAALATWAGQHGMVASPALYASLVSSSGPFIAARFSGTGAPTLTPTLRIVRPGPDPTLPFVLTEAAGQPLDVTLFTLATSPPILDGEPAVVATEALVFDAASGTSNYVALRDDALDSPDRWLTEVSSHPRLDTPIDVTPNTSLPSLLGSYYVRGVTYEPVGTSANDCFAAASDTMQAGLVGQACPAAALGVVGGGDDGCVETGGDAPPSTLRCNLGEDSPLGDLALAFSGKHAGDMVLSRIAMRIPAGELGAVTTVSFVPSLSSSPVLDAATVDYSDCPTGGSSSSSSGTGRVVVAGVGAGGEGPRTDGSGGRRRVPVYAEVDGSCGRTGDVGAPAFYLDVDDTEDAPDAYYTDGSDDCGGDTSDSYDAVYDADGDGVSNDVSYDGDDCGGDTYDDAEWEDDYDEDCGGDTYDDADTHEGDDCGGDTYDDADYDEDCGGDTSDGYEWGEDDCGGDSSDTSSESCGGDSDTGDGCTISRGRRRPRLSAITLSLVALLFPLRRWRRPRRRRRVKRG